MNTFCIETCAARKLRTVVECQVNFGFPPAKSQILIRTASFLQKFIALENSLCLPFVNDARRQLHDIFVQLGLVLRLHVSCIMLSAQTFLVTLRVD